MADETNLTEAAATPTASTSPATTAQQDVHPVGSNQPSPPADPGGATATTEAATQPNVIRRVGWAVAPPPAPDTAPVVQAAEAEQAPAGPKMTFTPSMYWDHGKPIQRPAPGEAAGVVAAESDRAA